MISRRMSRPLEEIKAGVDRFAAGELNHRLRVVGSAEVTALAETMNRMAEQLDERIRTVLRQQNERDAMLSSMEEGVLAVYNDGTILSLNNACATLLGEDVARLQGRGIYQVVRKADLLHFIETALASPSPVEGEFQFAAQQDRWVIAHGTLLHDPQRARSACWSCCTTSRDCGTWKRYAATSWPTSRTNCGRRSRRSRVFSKPLWTARWKTRRTPSDSCKSCCGR